MTGQKLQTFVEFILPSKNVPMGTPVYRQVNDRSIETLDIPDQAISFSFFDRPPLLSGEKDIAGVQENISKTYVIAREIWTREQFLKWLDDHPEKLRRRGQTERQSRITRAVWYTKARSHSHHAVTPGGEIIGLSETHIAIDADKKIIWPETPKRIKLMKPIRYINKPQS